MKQTEFNKKLLKKFLKVPEPQKGFSTVELMSLKEQIIKCHKEGTPIVCPYCLGTNEQDKPFCCGLIKAAIQLIFAPTEESTECLTN